jgi:phage shock protein PspC (stress-responsive transcriptional regulator)
MQAYQPYVFNRPDTFFGVCEALGEDLRFNANILRVALAVPLIWYPAAMIGVYAALGLVVLASRLLFPNPRPAAETIVEIEPQPVAAAEEERAPEFAMAA